MSESFTADSEEIERVMSDFEPMDSEEEKEYWEQRDPLPDEVQLFAERTMHKFIDDPDMRPRDVVIMANEMFSHHDLSNEQLAEITGYSHSAAGIGAEKVEEVLEAR